MLYGSPELQLGVHCQDLDPEFTFDLSLAASTTSIPEVDSHKQATQEQNTPPQTQWPETLKRHGHLNHNSSRPGMRGNMRLPSLTWNAYKTK